MALSGNYDEIVSAYVKDTTATGITVTRQFYDDTSETEDLPQVGDRLSVSFPNILVTRVSEVYHGGHPGKKLYTIHYRSRSSDVNAAAPSAAPDRLPITGNMAGELMSIEGKGSNYTWTDSGDDIDQTIF